MTPEPSDCCTRWRICGEAPKNCWNSGSVKNGLIGAWTTRARIDIDHRGRDALDDRREGELHILRVMRSCGGSGSGWRRLRAAGSARRHAGDEQVAATANARTP